MRKIIILFTIIFSSLLWWGVYLADNNNRKTTINFFQNEQRDVLRVAQSSFINWLDNMSAINPEVDWTEVGQEWYRQYSSPIAPTTYGDIFIFANGMPVFDNYNIFLDKYPNQRLVDFIGVQAEAAGAEHYYTLVDQINKHADGQGWWIWDAERRGVEWAVWQPLQYGGQNYMLLMTTPEQLIFDIAAVSQNKLYYSFIASIANILLILVFIFFYYWQEKKVKDALDASGNVATIQDLQHRLDKQKLAAEHSEQKLRQSQEELESAMNLMIEKDYQINDLQNKLKDKLSG
ncbi:MAG: hypothetical protein ACKKL5_03220 [Candidatus Komeilibacteria bacterium]